MKILNPLAKDGKINEDAGVRDKQSIIINAPVEKVWNILVDIPNWPDWNQDIKIDRIGSVAEGESFKWQLQGQSIKSVIQKIEKHQLLTWTSQSQLTKAVNVWRCEDAGDNQTIVTIEESIQGFLTVFFGHQKLHNILLNWLGRLKKKAEE